jgi:hypothetical protein
MSMNREEQFADLVALVEELESSYARKLMQSVAVEEIVCRDMSTADAFLRTIRSEMLKRFAEENSAKEGEEL